MSSSCDYNDAYILVKGTIAEDQASNAANKKVIFKNCVLFNDYVSKINNMQVHDAHDIDVVMSIYNLIEYSDNYSKTSEVLWQYCRDEPTLDNNNDLDNY